MAAPREAEAVAAGLGAPPPGEPWVRVELSDHLDLVRLGVGKAAAAGGIARALDPRRHRGMISLGIAGTLDPAGKHPAIGDIVLATRSVLDGDGVLAGEGLVTLEQMGFGPFPDGGIGIAGDPDLTAPVEGLIGMRGVVASVGAGSGTDDAAGGVRARTGAIAEAMEGAAVGLVAARLGVGFAELRAISNTTGERAAQRWDLDRALERLGALGSRLAGRA